jgi:hypothetical protein
MKKKSNFIWRVIFILLLIANTLLVSWAVNVTSGPVYGADLRGVALAFLSLPLLIIDFIAIFTYILKRRPKSIIVNTISYNCLALVCFMLIFNALPYIALFLDMKAFEAFGTSVVSPFNVSPYILIELPFRIGVSIVATIIIIIFLRINLKLHK